MRIACGSALERKTIACGSGKKRIACGSALEKIKYCLRLEKKEDRLRLREKMSISPAALEAKYSLSL
jgi:hypothetical protein